MPFDVWDYRRDIRNVVVTPEIRSRFMRLLPGEVGARHTHDLAHEVFLVLQGQADFEIDGEHRVLGPGEMCFAGANQQHEVRAVGDEPMIMYLSVTPHLEPTHTQWGAEGAKLSPRYGTSTTPEERPASGLSLAELADRQAAASAALAEAATANAQAQAKAAVSLKKALAVGDAAGAKATVDEMWRSFSQTFQRLQDLEAVWNELAPRAAGQS